MLSGLNMRNEPINASIEPAAKVEICVREVFNINSDLVVIGFKDPDAYVPDIDAGYHFNKEATLAILAGFEHKA